MFNPYEQPEPEIVYECESCREPIYKGEDAYWIEVKGLHHLRFCTREEAMEYAYKMGANPDYVSWIEADNYENQVESDDSFVSIEESWE